MNEWINDHRNINQMCFSKQGSETLWLWLGFGQLEMNPNGSVRQKQTADFFKVYLILPNSSSGI